MFSFILLAAIFPRPIRPPYTHGVRGSNERHPSRGHLTPTAERGPAAFGIRHPDNHLFDCFRGNNGIRCGAALLHQVKKPHGNADAPHRRSCSHGCRRYRHGSAYGTKSSDLRACRALLGYLVLPGTIRLAFHSGIHPHLAQRRGDAFPLPSPVGAVADGCGMPATSSAFALGAAHARGSAASQ